MFKIKEAIIVEGTYDKIKLQQMVDGTIIAVNGFNIFKDRSMLELIKKIAYKTGIVVLTDSDRAGFLIRNYIRNCIPSQFVKHAYIPEIHGVERRKRSPGKEGLLGVEGVNNALIKEALQKSGCTIGDIDVVCKTGKKITKSDLYEDDIIGKKNSRELRKKLTDMLRLPSKISTNALLDVITILYTYEEYKEIIKKVKTGSRSIKS